MAKYDPTQPDLARIHSEGQLVAVGVSAPACVDYTANLFIWGDAAGFSAQLEASFDGGTTFLPERLDDGSIRTITANQRLVVDEVERGMLYRLNLTAIAGGTLHWRFSA